VPNVIDTCALALGIRAADASKAAAMMKFFTPRIRFVSWNSAMTETLLDTVVPEFGFPCLSTEAPLTVGFLRKDSLPHPDRQHRFVPVGCELEHSHFECAPLVATRYSSTVCIFPAPGFC
jgi:hypothetical protein